MLPWVPWVWKTEKPCFTEINSCQISRTCRHVIIHSFCQTEISENRELQNKWSTQKIDASIRIYFVLKRATSFLWNHNEVVLAAKRAFSNSCWSIATIIVRLSSLGELTKGWSSSVSECLLLLSVIDPFPRRMMTPRGLMMSGRSKTMLMMRVKISAWSDALL